MLLRWDAWWLRCKARAARAMRRVLERAAMALVSVEVRSKDRSGMLSPLAEMRWKACQKCPSLAARSRCTKCGCYMPAKVKITSAKCPEGKW